MAQTPKTYTSSEILLQIKKLNVLGSVLYIAAHPDDENTRLLGYLANEKLFRTGYLSLTRGDGGQNLIGDEQGIDLGLIRTQELLAARRMDGAEQFFSRAFDFGYSKSPQEALKFWDHDKILSDVVLVIRKFRPDIIISRFPTTGEGGHGHHTASAILAEEAFAAAADPSKFPEQLSNEIITWQARRLLWNSFNFGGTNTQRDDQFKMDVGGFNALLGKSYGEIAALSRSQHKSQGFGVPAQRGTILEYFATIKGDKPAVHMMDGVTTTWKRTGHEMLQEKINAVEKNYEHGHPEKSVPALIELYDETEKVKDPYWRKIKLNEIQQLIERCSGIFMEAVSATEYAVPGDSLKITMLLNNRLGINISSAEAIFDQKNFVLDSLKKNQNVTIVKSAFIPPGAELTQPYWLKEKMDKGSFNIADQSLIGDAESKPPSVKFILTLSGRKFAFEKPIQYKYTDPVKGELYEPLCIASPVSFTAIKPLLVGKVTDAKMATVEVAAYRNINLVDPLLLSTTPSITNKINPDINLGRFAPLDLSKNEKKMVSFPLLPGTFTLGAQEYTNGFDQQIRTIRYDHIPAIHYFRQARIEYKLIDVKIIGKTVGYITGAGDKVPEAIEQMGYKVVLLKEQDITNVNLRQFDAVVTGIRAYNTNEWMNNVYEVLMQYVKDGGVLLSQYNTSNQIGPVKAKIGPYPFTITRNRVTDEDAKVNVLIPSHPVFNYPNIISEKDFEGWVQERSVYHAETADSNFTSLISMSDPGEKVHDGSLVIANYGKGRFVYTGLSFFRQLPAGVPGAYRLFANLIAGKKEN